MPLLRRKPFERNRSCERLPDHAEVFHCEITSEIFQDYEEYCERIILVNSMVWSCEVTGQSNLTFAEALESEKRARKQLRDFPMELKVPVLYLASRTRRGAFPKMSEDIYNFVRDRYFVGETVEVCLDGETWCEAHVLSVIAPKNANANINSSVYNYEVERFDDEVSGACQGNITIVPCSRVRRGRGVFTRLKNQLYLKQFVEESPVGIVQIKESMLERYNINKVKFDQIFAGDPPIFPSSKKFDRLLRGMLNKNSPKRNSLEKKARQETISKYVMKTDKSDDKKQISLTENNKLDQHWKSQNGVVTNCSPKSSIVPKPSKKERTLMFAAYMKEWNKIRDDLELDDHKPLPKTIEIDLPGIPSKYFGDFMYMLEFFLEFSKSIKTKYFFSGRIDLETLRRALTVREVAGPLSDIIQMLLSIIFNLQEEEAEEYNDRKDNRDINKLDDDSENNGEMTVLKGVQLATIASKWSQTYLSTPLHQLPLNSQTFSEVLRLHLLSSGNNVGENCAKWRYQQRGGYNSLDDPGLLFKLKNPHILKALSSKHITQLPLSYKIKLINCLINQILTFSTIRDFIEENQEKSRDIKNKIRSLQIAERKREAEFTLTRMKIKRDAANKKESEKLTGQQASDLDLEVCKKIEELQKESLIRKKKFEKEINEYHSHSFAFQSCLGTDRAFRRYWMFESVEGVFVEHVDIFSGRCLDKPVIPNPTLATAPPKDALSYIQKMFECELNGGNSDKENDSHNTSLIRSQLGTSIDSDDKLSDSKLTSIQELLMCTADSSNCPVHSSYQKVQWSFLESPEVLDELIKSLNRRGIRENELRQLLEQEKEQIAKYIEKCPKCSLNPLLFPSNGKIEAQARLARKYVDANLRNPPEMETNVVLELALRENLLYLENKIFHGALGDLAIKNIEEWREALSNNRYDKQCSELVWGYKGSPEGKNKFDNEAYRDPGNFLTGPEEITSDFEEEIIEDCTSVNVSSVRDLASALLQIEQAILHKHLKKPLGYNEKEVIKENKNNLNYDALKRWEISLMESTSYAQVFLHYHILENSIEWSKSLLNVCCRVCRRKNDDENMLLCDSCNKGYHMYCLKPKLTKVPKGDWFCYHCRPREKTPPKRKQRKIFREEESCDEMDDSNSWNGSTYQSLCCSCRSGGSLIQCSECNRGWHAECLHQPLQRKTTFVCSDCSKKSKSKDWDSKVRRCAADAMNNIDHYKKMLKQQHFSDSDSADEHVSRAKKKRRSSPENNKSNNNISLRSTKSNRSSNPINDSYDDSDSDETYKPIKDRRLVIKPNNNHINENGVRKSARHSDTAKRKSSNINMNGSSVIKKTRRSEAMQQAILEDLVNEVLNHKDCWPFNAPVTIEEAPDYFEFITEPMDFGTIKRKLKNGKYYDNMEFMHDSALVFNNCYKYNKDDDIVSKAGVRLQKFFEKRCKDLNLEGFSIGDSVDTQHIK